MGCEVLDLLARDEREGLGAGPHIHHRGRLAPTTRSVVRTPHRLDACLLEHAQHLRVVDVRVCVEVRPAKRDLDVDAHRQSRVSLR